MNAAFRTPLLAACFYASFPNPRTEGGAEPGFIVGLRPR